MASQRNIYMNKKNIIPFFVFALCCAFSEPKYCKLSDRIFVPYNKELKAQKRLYLVGSGGAMMDDIQKVNAHYTSFERLTVEQARRLYVEVAEGYLCRYNQNEQIRPYLHNYPFTIDNVDVMIGFENEQRQHMDQGFVALMYVSKNHRLLYRGYDHERRSFTDLYEEPYETARDIVLKENQSG